RANGKVVMTSQSGLLIGRDAEIMAAGFCANGEAGAILSQGRVSTGGGAVYLQAQEIAQQGIIEADSARSRAGQIELEAAASVHLGAASVWHLDDSTVCGAKTSSVHWSIDSQQLASKLTRRCST